MAEITPERVAYLRELYPTGWIKKYEIKNELGFPIEFKNHKFLYDIYNDMSPLQVILKPPQVGCTVMQTLKSFWVAKNLNKQIIYTLPTENDMNAMAGVTINRLIAQNPILQTWVKQHDTVSQKSVGDAIINYRGTWSAKQAMMIPSDLNIHDEVDASDPEVLTQYETRLQAKADGMRWYFSHPSLSGHGVDIYWQQSDKKEWYIKCNGCQQEQELIWPDSVSQKERIYICRFCKRPVGNDERRNGHWKATATGTFSGYHITQLMCPWITAEKIIQAYEDPSKTKQYFYNYVLGLPYVGSDDKISAATILKNCVNEVNDYSRRVIIGVDTGLPIHFVCLNADGIFYYDTCVDPTTGKDPYEQLADLLRRWPKSVLVADQGGDLIGIRKLQAQFPGRVFLCWYRKDRKTTENVKWGDGEEYGQVTVDRNNFIQLTVEQLRDLGRVRLNGTPDEWKEYAEHWENIYREKVVVKEQREKDDRTLYGNEYVWKRNGPDHWVHATIYALVGLTKYGADMAKIVNTQDALSGVRTGQVVRDEGVMLASRASMDL